MIKGKSKYEQLIRMNKKLLFIVQLNKIINNQLFLLINQKKDTKYNLYFHRINIVDKCIYIMILVIGQVHLNFSYFSTQVSSIYIFSFSCQQNLLNNSRYFIAIKILLILFLSKFIEMGQFFSLFLDLIVVSVYIVIYLGFTLVISFFFCIFDLSLAYSDANCIHDIMEHTKINLTLATWFKIMGYAALLFTIIMVILILLIKYNKYNKYIQKTFGQTQVPFIIKVIFYYIVFNALFLSIGAYLLWKEIYVTNKCNTFLEVYLIIRIIVGFLNTIVSILGIGWLINKKREQQSEKNKKKKNDKIN